MGDLSVLTHLFIYPIIYFCQYGIMNFLFILGVVFVLLLRLFQFRLLQLASMSLC